MRRPTVDLIWPRARVLQPQAPPLRQPASHVQAALARCRAPEAPRTGAGALQAAVASGLRRMPIPIPPTPSTRHTGVALLQPDPAPARTRVVQRSLLEKTVEKEEPKKEAVKITVAKSDEGGPESSLEVKMSDFQGKSSLNLTGIHTCGVRNCVVFCACENSTMFGRTFMIHTSNPAWLTGPALKILEQWGSMTSYIIGGNGTTENLSSYTSEWGPLNVTGIMVPLTQVGQYANIELKDCKITYWIENDPKETDEEKNKIIVFGKSYSFE